MNPETPLSAGHRSAAKAPHALEAPISPRSPHLVREEVETFTSAILRPHHGAGPEALEDLPAEAILEEPIVDLGEVYRAYGALKLSTTQTSSSELPDIGGITE